MDRGQQFPEELFHGTNADLNEGDIIEPRKGGLAWATDDPVWAEIFSREANFTNPIPDSTPTVYVVTPHNPADVEKHSYGVRNSYSSASGFRIVRRHNG